MSFRTAAVLLALLSPSAFAQFQLQHAIPKAPGVAVPAPGGFLGGSDDCTSVHVQLGPGPVAAEPFTTGTTGTQGQNELLCLAFGTTGIENDVWFDWTSLANGTAQVRTCGTTGIDTKIAVYPFLGATSCPPNGTAIACNDDACGLQTSVAWSTTTGTAYTIQLGTFPGASGGSGTFQISQQGPPSCGVWDDGAAENNLGLIAGGEMGWIHYFGCLSSAKSIASAYGGPPSIDGNSTRLRVYTDSDSNAANGVGPAAFALDTIITNSGTGIINSYPIAPSIPLFAPWAVALATADHVAGQFPGAMDQTSPTPHAWIVGNSSGPGSLDLVDLTNNSVPPMQMQAIGFPAAWLLRLEPDPACCDTGSLACFGGNNCPCGNGDPGSNGGCANGTGQGATLLGTGSPTIGADTLVLHVAGAVPAQPGLFFQADTTLMNPVAFGDGLRCCVSNVVRLFTLVADASGAAASDGSVGTDLGMPAPAGPISQHPANSLTPGDVRCYQYWYRDPNSSPCGNGFNLANSITVTWN